MKYFVYILQCQSTGRYYCGHTDDLERRLRQHNDPEYRSNATTRRFNGPWLLVWKERHENHSMAMKREKQIKGRDVKRFLSPSD